MFQDRANAPAPDLYAYKTADETVALSNALQNDDSLSVSVKSGRKYIFEFTLFVDSDTTTITDAFKCDLDASTATMTNFIASLSYSSSGGNNGWSFVSSTATDLLSGGSDSTNFTIRVYGACEPSADGTLALRWSPGNAANTTVVKRGSSLAVWRLA